MLRPLVIVPRRSNIIAIRVSVALRLAVIIAIIPPMRHKGTGLAQNGGFRRGTWSTKLFARRLSAIELLPVRRGPGRPLRPRLLVRKFCSG